MHLWSRSDPSTSSNALRIEAAGQDINRQPSLCTLMVLSATKRNSTPRLSVASSPLGCQTIRFQILPPPERPIGLRIRLFKAEMVEAMLYGCATRTMRTQDLAACVPPITRYYSASSAFGAKVVPFTNLHRMERRLREPVSNASKRQYGNVNMGSPGPLFSKTTQGSQSE